MRCIAGLLAAAAAVAGVAAAPPNFVIVVADDMGVNDFSNGGAPTIQTPNLDK